MAENDIPEPGQDNKPGDEPNLEVQIAELRRKHEDLNRGIAKYRGETVEKDRRIKELEEKLNAKPSSVPDLEDKFVTKEELAQIEQEKMVKEIQQFQDQAVKEFLEEYPEYNDDTEWNRVQKEFKDFYKTPTTLQGFKSVLHKIHKDFTKIDNKTTEQAKAEALIEQKSKSRLSLGGGSQKTSSNDDRLEDLKKRYPNLSKDALVQQIAELDAIYKERQK